MGIFSMKDEAQALRMLDPVEPPLFIFPQCVRNEQITISLKEKVAHLKEDAFLVTDMDGRGIVNVAGKPFHLRNFKQISDVDGQPLFKLRTKLAALQRTFFAEDERGTQLFRIKRQWAWKIKLHATLLTQTVSDRQVLELIGSHGGFHAEITLRDTGEVVALLSREFWNRKELMKNKKTYFCTVAPGVDLSIIVALCLAWDECKADDARAAAASGGGG